MAKKSAREKNGWENKRCTRFILLFTLFQLFSVIVGFMCISNNMRWKSIGNPLSSEQSFTVQSNCISLEMQGQGLTFTVIFKYFDSILGEGQFLTDWIFMLSEDLTGLLFWPMFEEVWNNMKNSSASSS